jgi:two-component system, NarL family, response regulator
MLRAAVRERSNATLGRSVSAHQCVTVLIFGDQRLLADSVGVVLGNEEGIVVVGNAPWGPESAVFAAALDPDVVVIESDLEAPLPGGAAQSVLQVTSRARVVFLASRKPDAFLLAALEAGASAVFDTRRPAAELVATVRRVARDVPCISGHEIAHLLERRRDGLAIRGRLTYREVEVLNRLAIGESSRAIAASLSISYLTVRTHLRNIAAKIGGHNRMEVLAKARQSGLVSDLPSPPLHATALESSVV